MAHNCPADWVYVWSLGCFESMADFWAVVELSLVTVLIVTAMLVIYRRWRFSSEGENREAET